jgi:hypothetical protein
MSTVSVINFTDPEQGSFNLNAFTSDGLNFPTSTTLNSSAVAANSTLLFYGKGHPNYGERVNEDLLHLLENFSGASAPKNPISGQQWFTRLIYIVTSIGYWRWIESTNTWVSFIPDITPIAPIIVNEGFWVDDSGSPNVLHLGIDDGAHPLSPTWLVRELEDLTAEAITDPNAAAYLPQRTIRVFDGTSWKNSGSVYTSEIPPQNPTDGDQWFDVNLLQLKLWHSGIWRESGGQYVNITGDTMTGVLQFGTPTGSMFMWEGGGDDTVAPDIRMTGNGLLTTQDHTYIHIDDQNTGTGIFEIAKGTQSRGGETSLFQVLNDGQIRSAIPNYETLVLIDPQNLTNREYVDAANIVQDVAVAADLAVINAQLAANVVQINTNTNDLLNTVARSGDTLTGFLLLHADPTIGAHAATKQYVDNQIGGGGGTDGVLTSGVFTPASRDLQLDTSAPSSINISLIHDHPALEVDVEAPSGHVFRDILGSGPDYNMQDVSDQILQILYERLQYLEAPSDREIFNIIGATTNIQLSDMEYQVGRNQLDVFVNGLKSYVSERAYQGIFTNSAFVLTPSSQTGITPDLTVYELDITVDGGVLQTVSATGTVLQTVQQIINEINIQATGIVANWNVITNSIRVYSNLQGNGSSIAITDGTTNGLLAALAAVTPGVELPVFVLGDINPPAAGPVSTVTQNLGYVETDGAFAPEIVGQNSSTIQFTAALTIGDIVEVISRTIKF